MICVKIANPLQRYAESTTNDLKQPLKKGRLKILRSNGHRHFFCVWQFKTPLIFHTV